MSLQLLQLLRLLERHREMAAAGEMVDMLMGKDIDPNVRNNLMRLTVDGYRIEGESFADTQSRAKLRVELMDKYGDKWMDCPEWNA